MNYFELRDKVELFVKEKDINRILELITVDSVKIINLHKMRLVGRQSFYESLRKNVPQLSKMTDDQFEILYNSDMTEDERKKRLKELGIEITKTEKPLKWHPFK